MYINIYLKNPPTEFVKVCTTPEIGILFYRSAEKSLARPGMKQARKHIRDARDFNNIETRAVINFLM